MSTKLVKGRKFGEPKSELEFAVDGDDFNPDMIPDEFTNRYVRMIYGSVVFVETCHEKHWTLWRVECVLEGPPIRGYITTRATEQEARYEIAKQQAKPS